MDLNVTWLCFQPGYENNAILNKMKLYYNIHKVQQKNGPYYSTKLHSKNFKIKLEEKSTLFSINYGIFSIVLINEVTMFQN